MQDERGRPALRKKLKLEKWKQQHGKCAICYNKLPQSESELDRLAVPALVTVVQVMLLLGKHVLT